MAKRPPSLTSKASRNGRQWASTSRIPRAKRGYGWEWEKQRGRILERDRHLCQPCLKRNRATPATEVDHVVPRSQKGGEADTNLQAICGDCHKAKTAREGHARRGE